jgi:hypothetical protein
MENEQTYQQEPQEVTVTPEIKAYLVEAANWGTFLAILGYLGIALGIISAIMIISLGGLISQNLEVFEYSYGLQDVSGLKFLFPIMGIITLVFCVLYFFPVYYLHQFSSKVKYGVNSINQEAFGTGVKNLKSLLKFFGIITIVIVVLSVLSILFVQIGVAIAS